MREIYQKVIELIESDEIGAYCTVVETKGSTPQKPGSKLLILPDLRNVGTLGGGCVEAEARRQAIGLMQGGVPRLLDFQLDSDYGWDDGLICGGNMKIFIDLPQTKEESLILTRLQELSEAKIPLVSTTVVKSEVDHIQVGAKMLFAANGEKVGSLGDTALETALQDELIEVLEKDAPGVFRWQPEDSVQFIGPRNGIRRERFGSLWMRSSHVPHCSLPAQGMSGKPYAILENGSALTLQSLMTALILPLKNVSPKPMRSSSVILRRSCVSIPSTI